MLVRTRAGHIERAFPYVLDQTGEPKASLPVLIAPVKGLRRKHDQIRKPVVGFRGKSSGGSPCQATTRDGRRGGNRAHNED
jgi:hypothetical protein